MSRPASAVPFFVSFMVVTYNVTNSKRWEGGGFKNNISALTGDIVVIHKLIGLTLDWINEASTAAGKPQELGSR